LVSKDKTGYWYGAGLYMDFAEQLNDLIPMQDGVPEPRKNRALEKFRRATNIYYDLYNNGLMNRSGEFYQVFGFGAKNYKLGFGRYRPDLYFKIEEKMDEFVLAAAKEQGLA